MEIFVLMGEIDYEGSDLLGVYASEEEAINARNVYVRDTRYAAFDGYYIQRQVLGAPANPEFTDRRYV